MTTIQVFAFIVIPLFIFLVGTAGSGIVFLVKGVNYMSRSQTAQESTAETNRDISTTLNTYIDKNDQRVGQIELDIARIREHIPPLNGRAR